jgi:dienelactone hydrolase
MGAKIGEVDEICAPLMEISRQGDDDGTTLFFQRFTEMGDKLVSLATEDEAQGRLFSAGEKLSRAVTYFITAERMQAPRSVPRQALYQKVLSSFSRRIKLGRENCQRVEIPYEHANISGLFVKADSVTGPAPCVVLVNGLDVTKEFLYGMRLPHALARRGISSLVIDQPGTGEALRLHGLKAIYESERWGSRVVDWLETRSDVDAKRIGLAGISLGGYYVPRAVAFEPRFALGVVWGAIYDWGQVNKRRLVREGDRPVPHYWDHCQWVWDAKTVEEFMAKAEKVTVKGFLNRIKVPFLVTHGEKDRQIPVEQAHATYEGLVSSPKREIKVFTAREGGVEHCNADNFAGARDFIADWIAEVFGGRTA